MTEIGSTLRETRMRARIDISDVEAHTKIRAKYLRALENEEWNLLPGPVYVRSFLKTYGDYLGLDSRLLVDEFKRRYEGPAEHESRVTAARARERERDRSRRPVRISSTLFSPVGVIVVAVIVIVVALYVIGRHSNQHTGAASATITATSGHGGTTPSLTTHRRHRSHGAGKTVKATTSPRGKSTVTTPTTTTTSGVATLAMVPTSTIWVCVETADGKTVYTGAYTVGETMPKASSSALLVTLGNDSVTMTVNGQPYTPPRGSPIGLKITPQGVTGLTTPPTCR
jgi:cytoskeletal protein RodZ